MSIYGRLMLVAALTVGVVSLAGAEVVSYSGDLTFTALGDSGTIGIPQWQSSLGTLNSVTVTFWDGGQGIFSATAEGAIESANGDINRGYHVVGVGFADVDELYTVHGQPYTNLTDGQTISPERIWFSNSTSSSHTIASADYGLYTGTGNVSFLVSVPISNVYNFQDTQTTSTGGGRLDAHFTDSNLVVGARVTYNYTPGVPEPMSLALLPMALGGVMIWRRRRVS